MGKEKLLPNEIIVLVHNSGENSDKYQNRSESNKRHWVTNKRKRKNQCKHSA